MAGSFVSDIMDGVVVVNSDSTITLMNSVAEHLLCVKSFMALGKKLKDLDGQGELLSALIEDHAKVRSERQVTRTVEAHHTQHDLLYIKLRTGRLLDYRGEPAGVISVLDNVTKDFKSDQLKNQYLSIVAHELRTPLTGIKTFSTMMARKKLGPLSEPQQRAVEAIREQSLRLEHQIDKLINLGYLDSSDYGQDLEVFDLPEFLAQAAAPFQAPAQERHIELRVECPPGIRLQADRADLKRALQALIENALKFSPEGGRVQVQAEQTEAGVSVLVRDQGIGVHPRYQRRIFEKFFQVEDPLTRHHGGAGLGLFVAGQILEAHGSKVEVASELGKGAIFSFRLPTYQGEQPAQTASEPESVAASARE
jgi:signal transduction histidine kinase